MWYSVPNLGPCKENTLWSCQSCFNLSIICGTSCRIIMNISTTTKCIQQILWEFRVFIIIHKLREVHQKVVQHVRYNPPQIWLLQFVLHYTYLINVDVIGRPQNVIPYVRCGCTREKYSILNTSTGTICFNFIYSIASDEFSEILWMR